MSEERLVKQVSMRQETKQERKSFRKDPICDREIIFSRLKKWQ